MAVPGPSTPPLPAPAPSPSLPTPPPSAAAAGPSTAPLSGLRSALLYTGLPPSLLRARKLRLPSRNWLIFIGAVTSVSSLYVYDRRECARIRKEACERVRWMSELPLGPQEVVRRVRVLAAKQPGDEDAAKGMLYFRKWVKPILVAAAVDYDMLVGERHGSLATLIAREIHQKRLISAGLLAPPPHAPTLAHTPEAAAARELDGGVVLVGRATFKEYMEGLRRGWGEEIGPGKGGVGGDDEADARLAGELAGDGVFDEPEMKDVDAAPAPEEAPPAQIAPPQPPQPFKSPFLPDFQLRPNARIPQTQTQSQPTLPPVESLPPQPPLLLLPFRNLVGISLVPRQIWGFFNRRQYARSGAEHALLLLGNCTRALDPGRDLQFGAESEQWWPKAFDKHDEAVAKKRAEYYKELAKKLQVARALAAGERQPTKEELRVPPKTEQELRMERFEREKRWRGELEGWEVVRRGKDPAWDEGWRGAVRVYCPEEEKSEL